MDNAIRKNFTITPNELIDDNSISIQARFLFVYLASKPDDWKFYNSALNKALGISDDTRRKYMNELALKGWISKIQKKLETGQWCENDITLHPYPNFSGTVKTPPPKITAPEKNGSGKSPELNNNNVLTNTDLFTENEIPFLPKDIILYLNQKKGGAGFRLMDSNYTEIKARIKDKFQAEDFRKVIDAAIIKWKDDPVNKKFIRPETLFGKKFNSYLVEADDIINGTQITKTNEPKLNNNKQSYKFDALSIIEQQTDARQT